MQGYKVNCTRPFQSYKTLSIVQDPFNRTRPFLRDTCSTGNTLLYWYYKVLALILNLVLSPLTLTLTLIVSQELQVGKTKARPLELDQLGEPVASLVWGSTYDLHHAN